MAKNAYIVVSDLHISGAQKDNRLDWDGEIRYNLSHISKVIEKYRGMCDGVYVIMLGDVYDRSYTGVGAGIRDFNRLVMLRFQLDGMYSVIGNHELTYQSNNPFYSLIHDVQSEKIKKYCSKMSDPVGLWNVIEVLDCIEDGDVLIHFNHYGTPINTPEAGKYNIGLFHQDLVNESILRSAEMELGKGIYQEKVIDFDSGILGGYQCCIFGHLHSIYGEWVYVNDRTGEEQRFMYLASLGRPNVSEVDNRGLERNLPAIVVENGKLVGVENNFFMLQRREECVDEEVTRQIQEAYKTRKEIAASRKELGDGFDPIERIRGTFISDGRLTDIVESMLNGSLDPYGLQLQNSVLEVMIRGKS